MKVIAMKPKGYRNRLSNATRELVIQSILRGESVKSIAEVLGLKYKTVYSVKWHYEKSGSSAARPRGGCHQPKLNEEQKQFVIDATKEDCTLTLKRLLQMLSERFDVNVSHQTISRVLRGFHFSLKRVRKKAVTAEEARVVEQRRRYAMWLNGLTKKEKKKLVFVDETGFAVLMRRFTGYSPVGKRAIKAVQAIRTTNYTVFAATTHSTMIPFIVQNKPGNTVTFLAFVKHLINYMKRRKMKNMTFIADNVVFHHSPRVRDAIEKPGHTIQFLPPYSPFLNMIDNIFSQWKERVRGGNPKNEAELMQLIQESSQTITPDNTKAFFKHMLEYVPKCINGEIIDG